MVDETRVDERRTAGTRSSSSCTWKETRWTTRELQVSVRDRGGTAVVDLHGEIDRSADERLAQAYARCDARRRARPSS